MSAARLGVGSLIASLAGLLALLVDVVTLAGSGAGGLSSLLEPVASAANLTGFLLGFVASRARRSGAAGPSAVADSAATAGTATAGLYLSWTPTVIVLVLFAAYRPQQAADLTLRLLGLVLKLFEGLSDLITLLAGG